jgi:hypothetical protein
LFPFQREKQLRRLSEFQEEQQAEKGKTPSLGIIFQNTLF